MALKKIIQVQGEAYINTADGQVSLGQQKNAFNAYCKIVSLSGTKNQGSINVQCEADGYKMVQQYQMPFSTDEGAPNFIKQAYLHLKTLPEWADATDC